MNLKEEVIVNEENLKEVDKEVDQAYLIFKTKAEKCKVISLVEMKFEIFTNPKTLNPRIRTKLLMKMQEWMKKEDKEVDDEFNGLVLDVLDTNYQSIPVLNVEEREDPMFHRDLPPM